jgi:hypothetical protein
MDAETRIAMGFASFDRLVLVGHLVSQLGLERDVPKHAPDVFC